jgi:8-oxo-dGTP diphosphatase
MKPVTPIVAVDIIIELQDWHPFTIGGLRLDGTVEPKVRKDGIVLIERKNEPFGWALPGGMQDVGERAIDAAVREALEETRLRVSGIEQFHTYTSPDRDPRGHGISIVYIARAIGTPVGADDAKRAIIVDPEEMAADLVEELCFDHREIITDYLTFKHTGLRPTRE